MFNWAKQQNLQVTRRLKRKAMIYINQGNIPVDPGSVLMLIVVPNPYNPNGDVTQNSSRAPVPETDLQVGGVQILSPAPGWGLTVPRGGLEPGDVIILGPGERIVIPSTEGGVSFLVSAYQADIVPERDAGWYVPPGT